MSIQQNDIYNIARESLRYKSLLNQYILLLESIENVNKEQALESIEHFIIYLTIYTNIRKIHRVEIKHLLLFAREQIQNRKDVSSEEILRALIKTLTILKCIHKLKTDVSLMNSRFWCDVLH